MTLNVVVENIYCYPKYILKYIEELMTFLAALVTEMFPIKKIAAVLVEMTINRAEPRHPYPFRTSHKFISIK